VKSIHLGIALAACSLLPACMRHQGIDPAAARYDNESRLSAAAARPDDTDHADRGDPASANAADSSVTTPATPPAAPPSPSQPPVVNIDRSTRDALENAALQQILQRYPPAKDTKLDEYLILVGSLLTLSADPGSADADYDYLLLETDHPVSFAAAPKTIAISRGLLMRMRDEAELAGVLAREITNLRSNRALAALGLTASDTPADAPDRNTVNQYSARLAETLLSPNLPPATTETADLEGARLASAAKYAPDGYLRILARLHPGAQPQSPIWERLRTLDANVSIVSKANPAADVRLPVRFESYVNRPTR
jgi:hypothetical protein